VRPPDVIIHDEFHLISGPLGTMVGLHETAVDALCSWADREDPRVRPRVVASTATVRRAGDQVRNVFMRREPPAESAGTAKTTSSRCSAPS
jgi:hypothetical protein